MYDPELFAMLEGLFASEIRDHARVRRQIEAVAGLDLADPPFPAIAPDLNTVVLMLAVRDVDIVGRLLDGNHDPEVN